METKTLKAIAAFCLILIFLFGCAEADSVNYKKLADTINDASDFGGYSLLDNYPGTPKNYDPVYPERIELLGDGG